MSAATPDEAAEVMGTTDAATFVIAAIDRDGAWLSMPAARAPTLADWR